MFNRKGLTILAASIVTFGGLGMVLGYSASQRSLPPVPGLPQSAANNQTIVLTSSADLNQDGVDDIIFVYGKPFAANSPYIQNLNVGVMDGKTQEIKTSDLKDFSGYGPRLSYGDFTGDGHLEVMLQVDTGGTGGIVQTAILDFAGASGVNIWGAVNDAGLQVTGQFIDGFKVRLDPFQGAPEAIIDVQHYRDFYIQQGLYDTQGKLLKPSTQLMVYPFGVLQIQPGDTATLFGIQAVKGITNLDTVSTLLSNFSYRDGAWQLDQLEYTTIWK